MNARNARKGDVKHHLTTRNFSMHPMRFVFMDRRTGAPRFEVKADKEGCMPIEEAASLMAVQCASRRQVPSDFNVLVSARENLMNSVLSRATELLESCAGKPLAIPLTRREGEVLRLLAENLTNKEIAVGLNLSTRTVKFHLSALFKKFGVHKRIELVLKTDSRLWQAEQRILAPNVVRRPVVTEIARPKATRPLAASAAGGGNHAS